MRGMAKRRLSFLIGIMKEYAKQFYKSKAWQACREGYMRSVGGLCERCYARGILTPGVIVHHKTYITPDNINDPTVTLNWDNLECVCRQCHEDEHKSGTHNRKPKRYMVDDFGHVVAVG